MISIIKSEKRHETKKAMSIICGKMINLIQSGFISIYVNEKHRTQKFEDEVTKGIGSQAEVYFGNDDIIGLKDIYG